MTRLSTRRQIRPIAAKLRSIATLSKRSSSPEWPMNSDLRTSSPFQDSYRMSGVGEMHVRQPLFPYPDLINHTPSKRKLLKPKTVPKTIALSNSNSSSNTSSNVSLGPDIVLYDQIAGSRVDGHALRSFPCNFPINPNFIRLYIKLPYPSSVAPENSNTAVYTNPDVSDLYSPRWTRGLGEKKVGLCPYCVTWPISSHPPHNGANVEKCEVSQEVWKPMKVSAYWYHLHFFHGISSKTNQPMSPPLEFRVRSLITKVSKQTSPVSVDIWEGLCHQCREWVTMENIRQRDRKNREIRWWQHATKCHTTII